MSAENQTQDAGSVPRLVGRLDEAAQYHHKQFCVWIRTAKECRESMEWIEADPERITRLEADRKCSWQETKEYNERQNEWADTQANLHADREKAIREAIAILSPNTDYTTPIRPSTPATDSKSTKE